MASQNVPGIAVMRANGYQTPVSLLIGWTGLTGLLLGPFGGYQFNLAAITAAICMSPEVDRQPERRYLAAVWAGIFYLVTLACFGATVAGLFHSRCRRNWWRPSPALPCSARRGNSLTGALR